MNNEWMTHKVTKTHMCDWWTNQSSLWQVNARLRYNRAIYERNWAWRMCMPDPGKMERIRSQFDDSLLLNHTTFHQTERIIHWWHISTTGRGRNTKCLDCLDRSCQTERRTIEDMGNLVSLWGKPVRKGSKQNHFRKIGSQRFFSFFFPHRTHRQVIVVDELLETVCIWLFACLFNLTFQHGCSTRNLM